MAENGCSQGQQALQTVATKMQQAGQQLVSVAHLGEVPNLRKYIRLK